MKISNNRLDVVENKLKHLDKPIFKLRELQRVIDIALKVAADCLSHYNQSYGYFTCLYNAITNREDPRLKGLRLTVTDLERKLERMNEILKGGE